jgi:hypothetical protein
VVFLFVKPDFEKFIEELLFDVGGFLEVFGLQILKKAFEDKFVVFFDSP